MLWKGHSAFICFAYHTDINPKGSFSKYHCNQNLRETADSQVEDHPHLRDFLSAESQVTSLRCRSHFQCYTCSYFLASTECALKLILAWVFCFGWFGFWLVFFFQGNSLMVISPSSPPDGGAPSSQLLRSLQKNQFRWPVFP